MSDAYNQSRYERARRDVRQEIEAEFHASAEAKIMALMERFVVAAEAIATALNSKDAPK